MDEPDPPTPAAATPTPLPPSSRLQRTLYSLRAPFRSGSPFYIGAAIKRSGSTKSSASDGEPTPRVRIMRKKNKKQKQDTDGAGTSQSTGGSPVVEPPTRKEGLVRRLGSFGRKRGEGALSKASAPRAPVPHLDEPSSEPRTPTPPALALATAPACCTRESDDESTPASGVSVVSAVSDVAVEHPVATKPFTKAAWMRRAPEMERPVEEPSPGDAVRRRIAFVAQASAYLSEDRPEPEEGGSDEGEAGRGVGSLEEAVALARARLAHSPSPSPSPGPRADVDTEEEGCAEDMAPYGDLLEPATGAATATTAAAAVASPPSTSSAPGGERREHLYKILVIGELGTGKTSIIKRYVHQFFSQHYRATIGVDFALKVLNWDANTIIRLQLWDIAGQERFGNMTRVYYKEAVGAFIVFDVTRVATFDAVVKWKSDLDAKVQLPDGSPIPCVLLANKCDQQKEGIVNSPTKMEEYCREKGFAGWFETSAKENINIEEAARSLVNKILLNDKLLQSNDSKDSDKFALDHKIANGENGRSSGGKSCAC